MDRLIKESDAIEAVWKPQVKPNELIFDALKQAIESEIRNCPTTEAYAWIPCSERLPEYLDTVLLSTFHGVRLGFRDHTDAYGDYWDLIDVDSTTTSQYVYAWMELPEPYEPKEEDE